MTRQTTRREIHVVKREKIRSHFRHSARRNTQIQRSGVTPKTDRQTETADLVSPTMD